VTTTPVLLASALEYAVRGWHVFPLHPGTTTPAVPRHTPDQCDRSDRWCRDGHVGWEARATTDLARITRIWSRPWGIGIACGPSELLVVDTDPDLGESTMTALARQHDPWPTTWTVTTPTGGVHRYYTRPRALDTLYRPLGPSVHAYGTGAYVVAPPTPTPGGTFTILLWNTVADLPTWTAALLGSPTG
jgi:hypothetical protein